MKGVAIVCLCLSLCLWVDGSPLERGPEDERNLERYFLQVYENKELENKKKFSPGILVAFKPCVREEFTQIDSKVLEAMYAFVDISEKCLKAPEDSKYSRSAYYICMEKEIGEPSEETLVVKREVEKVFAKCLKRSASEVLLNGGTLFEEV